MEIATNLHCLPARFVGNMKSIMVPSAGINYAERPMLVYWETTQACPLACRHCRACAISEPGRDQLCHEEAKLLIEDIASFGSPMPHLVLTAGDPLQRHGLFELIAHAKAKGLMVSITPAASPALTKQVFLDLKNAGIESVALSLDGSTPAKHDDIRQVPGCFATTIRAARWAGEVGLPLQINTLVSEETADDLPAIYDLVHAFPLMRWSLFFLIAVGRGKQLNEVDPKRGEQIMHWVQARIQSAPFQIKTTEAPSYRRIAMETMREQGLSDLEIRQTSVHRGFGIRDGNGIVFVSHDGKVYPSGFLPCEAGNIRNRPLTDI